MILVFTERHKRTIAFVFLFLMYSETMLAAYSHVLHMAQPAGWEQTVVRHTWPEEMGNQLEKKADTQKTWQKDVASGSAALAFDGGPSQPEMQQFTPVNSSNMVDLFSGDFSYNIPLLDVGGYPINISYRSGITMDQEASWVGLGWNINPGTISRSLRGLPDDFNGVDSVTKVMTTKENRTVGVSGGGDLEVIGVPSILAGIVGKAGIGVFNNSYKGWGIEKKFNASLSAGDKSSGTLTGGLSLTMTDNSQDGLTIQPTLSARMGEQESESKGAYGTMSLSSSYNSRSGLSSLQVSGGLYQVFKNGPLEGKHTFSFGYPSFTPTINIPYTSTQFSFNAKVGVVPTPAENYSYFIEGYGSSQTVEPGDRKLSLPAYGYLNYQNGVSNNQSLLDFNREKDIPYREKPAVPHIAIPSYTYDLFSITGEGVGGSFRPYRGDIGYVHDHYMHTKTQSTGLSVDLGFGNGAHQGVDINLNHSNTQTGAWDNDNALAATANFKSSYGLFEAAYMRNPGEQTINSKAFYDAIGGDNVVVPELYKNGSFITTTNNLRLFSDKKQVGTVALTPQSAVKPERDKRGQVITYLTAEEAGRVGLNKYIESHAVNVFNIKDTCDKTYDDETDKEDGTGLWAQYYPNRDLLPPVRWEGPEPTITHYWGTSFPVLPCDREHPCINRDDYSIRWTGRFKAPVTGSYRFRSFNTDDGSRLWINDIKLIDNWREQPRLTTDGTMEMNLLAGEEYNIRYEYYEKHDKAFVQLQWTFPGQDWQDIPAKYLYYKPLQDSFHIADRLVKEKRINSFRKSSHISEIDVLNQDGRRYVYGIPVYNCSQTEATFSVDKSNGNAVTGLTNYVKGTDDSPEKNKNGSDNFYSSEEMPAYAHSFLLTGILSPDYVDVTGDGISDDDPGDAIKFNYSKTAGFTDAYGWRTPCSDSATYIEGLRTDSRDDKASYVYGKKEMWYLHSIESKNMVAAFFLDNKAWREDGQEIDENGIKTKTPKIKRLWKIALYNKAEFLQKDTFATPVKTVYFEHSYELCKGVDGTTKGKLTLKKIWFTYNGNEKAQKNPYVFNYHKNNPGYNSGFFDRWGNYKSPNDNPSTDGIISNADYPYAIQDSTKAAYNVAAWTLNQIKLPSGGIINVDYESDDYAFVQDKRAMQMCKLAGLSATRHASDMTSTLYDGGPEKRYAFIKVPEPVTSVRDVRSRYLDGIQKMYLHIYVAMPGDKWGKGYEYVPCYVDIDASDCGFEGDMIWVKIKGMDGADGSSPLVKTVMNFLRLNLPSKAYPGSQVGDSPDFGDAVRILLSMVDNIANTLTSFENVAKIKKWAQRIDLNRSFVKLACPSFKRMGGGLRVKRVTVYDNWYAMTQQKEATYGQEYSYTTTREVDGKNILISSGVASYEPGIGGEENPFHVPIEYKEQVAPLAPVSMGYTEEPLGESFFPAPSVGYSKVRVRSIHSKNKRSANGYEETCFYTAYDFPTKVDWSVIDDDSKKRFVPGLANLLKIDAKHFLTIAQGFKVELNDMHGKMRSKATYAENDPENFVTYTENVYKVDNPLAEQKHLSNTVMAVMPNGDIDPEAFVGKDAELMLDMREQQTVVNGFNLSPNADWVFSFPIWVIPSMIGMIQREETRFRSAGAVKVIQRFGLIDSVIAIDKGSRVATRNMLYDSETGEVLLTHTRNEFNDSVFNFTYPAHWAYDGMGMGYKNIGLILNGIFIKDGKITQGLAASEVNNYFASGDELLVGSKISIEKGANCGPDKYTTFPSYTKIWAVDANAVTGGTPDLYFVDKEGHAFGGNDIALKVVRSGRRNMAGPAGTVVSSHNPIVKVNGKYTLQLNTDKQVLNASVAHYNQVWKVADNKKLARVVTYTCPEGYVYDSLAGTCVKDVTPVSIQEASTICAAEGNDVYSCCGTYVYSSYNVDNTQFDRSPLNGVDTFWSGKAVCKNQPVTHAPSSQPPPQSRMAAATYMKDSSTQLKAFGTLAIKATQGPLNRTIIQPCTPTQDSMWYAFNFPVNIPRTDSFYIGYGGDNLIKISIDGELIRDHSDTLNKKDNGENFTVWHIIRKGLTGGMHQLKLEYLDLGDPEGIGMEIYYNTRAQLAAANNYDSLNVIFSTKDMIGATNPRIDSCPPGYYIAYSGIGTKVCRMTAAPTDTLVSFYCYSAITDTVVNPYTFGLLGNFKADTVYTFYGDRENASVADPTSGNIRHDGYFKEFVPFWQFDNNKKLQMKADPSKWVWTSTSTLYNVKGFELENKDPLNRYNAGLYGYNLTLPTAVVQNSRYREAAFEGFEDYFYTSNSCGVATCPTGRHFDFSAWTSRLSTEEKHSGKYSLKLNAGDTVGIGATVINELEDVPELHFNMMNSSCTAGSYLKDLRTNNTALLPSFTPVGGKKVVFSAWVKEMRDCKCESYTGNKVIIGVNTASTFASYTLVPSGNIIEGWQRYEGVIELPQEAVQIGINFIASGNTAVYFDDIRLHPYNANMKSFVYHPVNLRLMAELDENNYATFYEYDDDGTLVRVKKETERGIKTIKETRSALRVEE